MNFFDVIWEATGMATVMESLSQKIFTKKVEDKPNPQDEYIPQPIKSNQFVYRPQTFSQYISQDRAKDKIQLTIEIIKTFAPRHFLLMGNAGAGKTTMAGIIANTLDMNLCVYVGSSFDIATMNDFIDKNNQSQKPSILFIDEIAEVDKKTLTYMLPIIEDFKLNNRNIRKFVLVGATTDSWLISKRCQPFMDRIHCKINLEDYTANDIKKLITQYNDQVYKFNISSENYDILSRNVRFTPRLAIAFFDYLVATKGDINRVLKMNRIIKDGLDDIDIKILENLLSSNGKAIGEEALAVIANMSRQEYKQLREPYLIRQGLISRGRAGRIILEKGKQFLQEIGDK
jgi:Holliday junction resolvasome RuvABC ATP-dependent DNA helicase subunit